jgi:bifunctional isochorismate lyase / aryl carrier protein
MRMSSLPEIRPYPLPGAGELPAGRARWRPDPDRAALLVHDMQRYFLAPYAGAPLPEATANIARLAGFARALGVPVFYTAQPGRQEASDRGLLREFWGEGIGAVIDADPRAADIAPELAPETADTVVVKWRYSAFQRSTFAQQLAAFGRDQLLITGVYAHIGCQATAVEAFMRDLQPFLVADAVADFSRTHHDQACAYVAGTCGVVTTTADVLTALAAPAAAGAPTRTGAAR